MVSNYVPKGGRLNRRRVIEDIAYLMETYRDKPVEYVHDVLMAECDEWQGKFLRSLVENKRTAVKSGHGIGKTASVAFAIHWFISTREHPQIVVTANTLPQLQGKTWRELAKWNQRALNGHWFQWTATKFYFKLYPETWFANAVAWSRERSEAFAGTHDKDVLMIFDEASMIDDEIWEVAEGSLTTVGSRIAALGNPTRNTGRFRECWRKFMHRWNGITVDAEKARFTDKEIIKEWIEDYGEDSDFVRVRVRGLFPRAASNQLIREDLLYKCFENKLSDRDIFHEQMIMSIDVARGGDDSSVLSFRRGYKVYEQISFQTNDENLLVGFAIDEGLKRNVSVCAVDAIGLGAGVADILREKNEFVVVEVMSSHASSQPNRFLNARAEMYWTLRELVHAGVLDIPQDKELQEDLLAIEYGYNSRMQIQIESKKDIKAKLGRSPDRADSLALLFAPQLNAAFSMRAKRREIKIKRWSKAWE